MAKHKICDHPTAKLIRERGLQRDVTSKAALCRTSCGCERTGFGAVSTMRQAADDGKVVTDLGQLLQARRDSLVPSRRL